MAAARLKLKTKSIDPKIFLSQRLTASPKVFPSRQSNKNIFIPLTFILLHQIHVIESRISAASHARIQPRPSPQKPKPIRPHQPKWLFKDYILLKMFQLWYFNWVFVSFLLLTFRVFRPASRYYHLTIYTRTSPATKPIAQVYGYDGDGVLQRRRGCECEYGKSNREHIAPMGHICYTSEILY